VLEAIFLRERCSHLSIGIVFDPNTIDFSAVIASA